LLIRNMEKIRPGSICSSMVLESLRRVAEYSADIAEVAINMNIKQV
ncbi:MAG TPA: phosphate uptake regulator PhoU, partial [Methanosarcina sp.]|nr:phosphate uptake regulator PhoU [Methanosarcina sp.]